MRVTVPDMIRCVEREIELRKHVYKSRVLGGKMNRDSAVLELTRMRAVLATLKALAGLLDGVDIRIPDREAVADE